jgi:hypothetical protein
VTVTEPRAGAVDDLAPYPVPVGRGRWRLTLHRREFHDEGYNANTGQPGGDGWQSTLLRELVGVRGRRLDQEWAKGAALTFTVDGRSEEALAIRELEHDVYAWRWDDWTGRDVCVGRFIVSHAEDQVSEQSHSVTYGCRDYLAMLERRYLAAGNSYNNGTPTPNTQDQAVANLVWSYGVYSSGTTFTGGQTTLQPGWWLPLAVAMVNPDGTARTAHGPRRDRLWEPGSEIFATIDDLSKVINGFDFDVLPAPEVPAELVGDGASPIPGIYNVPANVDVVRIFYPQQGVGRTDMALVYGGNVSSLTRTLSSADYANRVWAIGKKADAYAPQLRSDAYNADAYGRTLGGWMSVLNNPDVTLQTTLDEQAQGNLALVGDLVPSYTLQLRPGSYMYGKPRMGDVVPLVIQSGRLDVQTELRVLGITYAIGDDGDEGVELVVGRRPPSFTRLFRDTKRTVDALTRK